MNNMGAILIELQWLAAAPVYRGSIHTYLWQPHTSPPEPISARIFLSSCKEGGSRNVLVFLESWDRSYGSITTYECDVIAGPKNYARTSASVMEAIYLCLFAVFKCLIEDSSSFMESADAEILRLVGYPILKEVIPSI